MLPLGAVAGNVKIIELPGVGEVSADPGGHTLTFTSYRPGVVPMEFSVCWNEITWNSNEKLYEGSTRCVQGEVGGWQKPEFETPTRTITLPHYRTVTITVGRYDKIAVAVCRENDGRIGCVNLGSPGNSSQCQIAAPSNPIDVVEWGEVVHPVKVTVSSGSSISIKPTIRVPAEDLGKRALLLMYIEQSNGHNELMTSSDLVVLDSTMVVDLMGYCIPASNISFPLTVYVGYQAGGSIKYTYYIIDSI